VTADSIVSGLAWFWLLDAKGECYSILYEFAARQWRKVRKPDSIRKLPGDIRGKPEGEAGFAGTAWPGQREQAIFSEKSRRLS